MANFMEKLGNTDRRIIFLLMALAVILPLALRLNLPIPIDEGPSKDVFDAVDALPEGARVLLSFDYDPSTMPELQPMAVALCQHLMTRDIRIVSMALWPMGVSLGNEALMAVGDSLGKEEYTDWVNLGYKTGGGVLIVRMGSNIQSVFPTDYDGNPVDGMPVMEGLNKLSDIDMIISLSAGDPGLPAWVMMAGDRYDIPIAGGCTAVSAPQFYPYLGTGQMIGLLGGLKGAADYETMVRIGVDDVAAGTATPGMAAQSVAHLVIMLFIIIGNIAYLAGKKKGGAK
ncbi:hypothetical protein CSA37_02370 [Candidatus Fermentibacteria bacterium]|nr:MAG: hypothetical protein CSA37_02370 [Candidatus Fermentibacteria bacterium]